MSQDPLASYPRYVATLTGDGPVAWFVTYEEPARWRDSTSAVGRRITLAERGLADTREEAIRHALAASEADMDERRRAEIVERIEVLRVTIAPTADELERMLDLDATADPLRLLRGPKRPIPEEEMLREGEKPAKREFDPRDYHD